MKSSLQQRLQSLVERHEELMRLLGEADVIHNQNKFREYSREYSELEPLVKTYNEFAAAEAAIINAENLLKDEDPEMRELAAEELILAKQQKEQTEEQLKILLLPKDPNDNSNIFLEIRAGAGGDEASIFAGNLFRMYHRYAEQQGWQVEIISSNSGEHGGYKEIIARIIGTGVYSRLKFESGAHRVQRVPDTEASGRIHTSTCTVAIMPEVAEVEEFIINPSDLRVDTYRASGAGGQHVNRTDSAIRITHIPTGVVVECQDERSQHKNRAKAMSVLQAKLLDAERRKQQQEQAATRKSLVGTGDRSERIRTYNYPQGRVTDHRINLTLYKLDHVMEGELSQVVDPLIREYQAELLAEFDSHSQ